MTAGENLKNKKKRRKYKSSPQKSEPSNKKSVYDVIGISSDVLLGEAKIVVYGDYLIEFYNHKGIIDITDTQIKINTKKAIYKITGADLFICGVTDDEIDISGKLLSVEREV